MTHAPATAVALGLLDALRGPSPCQERPLDTHTACGISWDANDILRFLGKCKWQERVDKPGAYHLIWMGAKSRGGASFDHKCFETRCVSCMSCVPKIVNQMRQKRRGHKSEERPTMQTVVEAVMPEIRDRFRDRMEDLLSNMAVHTGGVGVYRDTGS